jgi:hypothetical protein
MVYLDILFQIMVYVFYLILGFVINLFCVSIFKKATYLPFIISGIALLLSLFFLIAGLVSPQLFPFDLLHTSLIVFILFIGTIPPIFLFRK